MEREPFGLGSHGHLCAVLTEEHRDTLDRGFPMVTVWILRTFRNL
jgi:hypothetical protein